MQVLRTSPLPSPPYSSTSPSPHATTSATTRLHTVWPSSPQPQKSNRPANNPRQPSSSNSSPTLSAVVALELSRSSANSAASSPLMSTPSPSTPSTGSSSPSTVAGSASSSASSTLCTPRPMGARSRNSLSVSHTHCVKVDG